MSNAWPTVTVSCFVKGANPCASIDKLVTAHLEVGESVATIVIGGRCLFLIGFKIGRSQTRATNNSAAGILTRPLRVAEVTVCCALVAC